MNTPATESLVQLKRFVASIHALTEAEGEAFAAIWQTFEAKRKTVITTSGEVERHLYFVIEGVQRAYYLTNKDKEATIVFTYPFSFSGVADSFLTQTPSKYYFETLTQSHFLKTSYQQVATLMDAFPNFERMIRKATIFALMGALERQIELQCFSAEEKFTTLLSRSPHILRMVPHKYLASYMGIDAATFSKLLNTVRL